MEPLFLTAPTGHTLLLLDAAEAYHRDVARNLSYIPDSVRRLLPQLRNPDFTRILIVTLPEATPVHEAARLQEDLKRAGITPYAWVINQSFCATGTKDSVLAARGIRVSAGCLQKRSTARGGPEAPQGSNRGGFLYSQRMEAVLDSRWDVGRAITVVSVIGANYIECKRKTKIFSSGGEFPRKLRLLWV